MIAVWMLYGALWTLWLSCTAILVERIMLGARGPVRIVWFGTIVLSLLAPVAAGTASRLKPSPAPPAMSVVATTRAIPALDQPPNFRRVEAPIRSPVPAQPTITLRMIAARADRPLLVVWIALSLGLCAYFAGGMLRLATLRRGWRSENIYGEAVLISDDTGPALVGFVDPAIVIPAWALSLDADALALMLRHEVEHRRAGDTRVLTLAQLLVVLMPWNVALWWQLRRLRLAIELDCDARVLAGNADVGVYGRLLLDFGRARRTVRFAGAALVDHATHLETRIRLMTKRARMPRGRAFVGSVVAGVVAIVVGCQLPAPPAPAPSTPRESRGPVVASVDSATKSSSVRDTAERTRAGADSLNVSRPDVGGEMRVSSARRAEATRLNAMIDSVESRSRLLQTLNTTVGFDTADALVMRTTYGLMNHWINENARALDSVGKEMNKLALIYTPEHPQMRQMAREMTRLQQQLEGRRTDLTKLQQRLGVSDLTQLQQQLTMAADSLSPGASVPGCSAGGPPPSAGKTLVKLVMPETAAASGGRIRFGSEAASVSGAKVAFAQLGMTCYSVEPGELRVFGLTPFNAPRIVVQSAFPLSVVVVTPSGRVLAGPLAVANETRDYDLSWAAR
jgi:beta-lactamase regulating signal transducer with metallopeptidase domain